MDALHALTPGGGALFLVEGTGQTAFGGVNWGNGFATDAALVERWGVSDASPFFDALLLSRPHYARRVALGPHAYPPSVTGGAVSGRALWERLTATFGYLTKRGYCARGGGGGGGGEVGGNTTAAAAAAAANASTTTTTACAVFPVVVAEFGSSWESAADVAWMADFAAWMANEEGSAAADDDAHARVDSWGWWAWNANSGDTGGLVTPNWHTLQWAKLRFLVDRMGLRPWYLGVEAD
jgi:hypothetical protein